MKKQVVMILVGLLALTSGSEIFAATPKNISSFPEGERLVYTRLVEAYRHGQLDKVVSERGLLERNYPNSIHLDNAYYMTGMLQYQNQHFGEALKSFDVVRYRFAKSKKRPSALLATAVTYEQLRLAPQARRVFESIMKEYPGSPESQRAWMHLKMADGQTKKTAKR